MNIIIWILQGLTAFIFLFSGFNKAYFNEKTLVQKGQTVVEGFSIEFIKFIGISTILGTLALILPLFFGKYIFLIPLASICLGFIMIPAAYIHSKRTEFKNAIINSIILLVCSFIAFYYLK